VSIALDASMAMAWCFEDERNLESDAVLDRIITKGAFVPSLWKIEVANSLQVAIRRKRIDRQYRDLALVRLQNLPIETDPETSLHVWSDGIRLADRELAIRRQLPLATLDGALAEAGRQAGLPLLQ
jgi:predicted nucleic acid-binding protein